MVVQVGGKSPLPGLLEVRVCLGQETGWKQASRRYEGVPGLGRSKRSDENGEDEDEDG